ncbi:Modification methylase [Sinorhizobium fredii CCBAU 25509]|nr:Modification methylase [Sinorhizobium fredii CCBAU 25509]
MSTISVTSLLACPVRPAIHGPIVLCQEPDLPSSFGVVDLFAGPGGLGEGFASLNENGKAPFRIGISVEKEPSAHATLRLRAFLREYRRLHGRLPRQFLEFHAGQSAEPDWVSVDKAAWTNASMEARRLELGDVDAAIEIDKAIDHVKSTHDDTILIGGPPCQAYSLVGRARAKGKRDYKPEEDERHFLFREYIRVLDRLRPAAFVMENVKGMLSSTVESRLVFEMLMEDLSSLGTGRGALYELRAVTIERGIIKLSEAVRPTDFVVRSEDFGVPQRRHRVIIIGLRADIASHGGRATAEIPGTGKQTVADAIANLPIVRSGLSRGDDSPERWRTVVLDAADRLHRLHKDEGSKSLADAFRDAGKVVESSESLPPRGSRLLPDGYGRSKNGIRSWLENPELTAIAQHETRGHMDTDLGRYLFSAVHGRVNGRSPKATDFPPILRPDHRNWHTGVFADRFRVQLANEPSTTITSHISKDGHYFIHPDPTQCRSLSVREAARLQTFPDDYLFQGNRTEQYIQVGNAVPPYLARQIAHLLLRVLDGASSGRSPSRSEELSAAVS